LRKPSLSTESLARLCASRPWLTIGIWAAAILISLALISLFLGNALTSEMGFVNNPESKQGNKLLEDGLGRKAKADEIVIVRSGNLTVDDPAFRALVEQLYGEIKALGPDIVESGINYYSYPTGTEGMASPDRHTTIISLVMAGTHDDALDHIGRVKDIVERHNSKDGFHVLITGDASLGDDWMKVAQKDLETAELIGIPIAAIILILVFGAVAAAFIPILLGFIAIIIAIGIVAVIGQAFEFSVFVTNMIVAMGLAVGIDYSLFIVSRYREERRRGQEKTDAIITAAATASRAVFFSGMTVVLALFGMLIVPTTLFTSLAAGAILVVIAAILTTLTLLPAILSLMGDRINSLRVPFFGRRSATEAEVKEGGFWDTAARIVMKRPVVSLLIAMGLLVAAIVPVTSFHLGATGVKSLPDSLESKRGFTILEEDFSFGLITPARIVIDGDINSAPVQAGIEYLTKTIESDPSFYGKPTLASDSTSNLAELTAPVKGDPNEDEAMDAVRRLRHDYIPEAFQGVDAKVVVTGSTAENIDYVDLTGHYLPIIFVFVLSLSFILLAVVFRSIVVPLKAILMNLLSVGATYGLVVLVFQKGIGAGILGLQELNKFEAWVPIFLFCVLFGLSMDYHVFLLSRIRERFDQTGNNTQSVAFGLRSTGSIITGAALIMVAVFSGFAAGNLVMFQQMGFGMAVAVFLDATIVRCVLVPSAMRLLGTRNWYLPKALKWLPQVRLRE